MRLANHYQLYYRNPEGYRNLTRSIFLRLEPFTSLYVRVEFLQGDEVAIDLMVRESKEERFISINSGSRHRIMSLDEDPALIDAITKMEGNNPQVKRSLEKLQETLIQELIE